MNQGYLTDKPHILIVDDDKEIANLVKQILFKNNFTAMAAYSTTQADVMLSYFRCDLILLDYMLDTTNGIEYLEIIRKKGFTTPVIMLTAINEIDVKLKSLTKGAEDYIAKPFNSEELILRAKNLLKRASQNTSKQIISFSDMTFNTKTDELFRGNINIPLSSHEAQLLKIFTSNLNKVVTKESILEATGKALTNEAFLSINMSIMRLRKKIDIKGTLTCLKTIRNQGFLLKA